MASIPQASTQPRNDRVCVYARVSTDDQRERRALQGKLAEGLVTVRAEALDALRNSLEAPKEEDEK